MGRSLRKILRSNSLKKAIAAKKAEADKKAQEQLAEENAAKQALATASEIKDSGRTTDVVNDTSETPDNANNPTAAASSSPVDDLTTYINNMRNRKSRRGAVLPNLSKALGQGGILGV